MKRLQRRLRKSLAVPKKKKMAYFLGRKGLQRLSIK